MIDTYNMFTIMFGTAALAQQGWDDELYSFLERRYSCCTTRPQLTSLK